MRFRAVVGGTAYERSSPGMSVQRALEKHPPRVALWRVAMLRRKVRYIYVTIRCEVSV